MRASSCLLAFVLAAALAAGCGKPTHGLTGPPDLAKPKVTDGSVGNPPQCPDPDCPAAGLTQCMGAFVQTCTTDDKGCLGWSAAAACGTGMTCEGGACIDVCLTPDLMKACALAVDVVRACCSGTQPNPDPITLCQLFVKAGKDPKQQCAMYNLQTACPTVTRDFATWKVGCCCDAGQACDPEHAGACVNTCTQRTSCSGNPYGNTCALIGQNNVVTAKQHVCRPDDGGPFHGCKLLANNGCDNGFDCWRDRANNTICTTSCNSDTDCKNPGIACCDKTAMCNKVVGACGGTGACMPCP